MTWFLWNLVPEKIAKRGARSKYKPVLVATSVMEVMLTAIGGSATRSYFLESELYRRLNQFYNCMKENVQK